MLDKRGAMLDVAREISAVVTGLISDRPLRKRFAGQLAADVRKKFRRLVDAVENER